MKNKIQEEIELTESDLEEIEELPEDLLEEEAEEPSLEDLVKRRESEIKKAGKAAKEVEQKGESRVEKVAGNIGVTEKQKEQAKEAVNFEERKEGIVSKMKSAFTEMKARMQKLLSGKQEAKPVEVEEETELAEEYIEKIEEKEAFDQVKEYKKVQKILESNQGPEVNKRAIKEYKKEVMKQKEGIAELQESLRKNIENNPELLVEKLMEKVENRAGEIRLTNKQKETFKEFLEAYAQKHKAVKSAREKYPNDKELFGACFGFEPKGKIKMEQCPMSFYFKCSNPEDFTGVLERSMGGNLSAYTRDIITRMAKAATVQDYSLIPGLNGLLIVENSKIMESRQEADEAKVHEEQHVLYNLFREKSVKGDIKEKMQQAKNKQEKAEAIVDYLRIYRRESMPGYRPKDEILAYYRQGEDLKKTLKRLSATKEEGGGYDYFFKKKESILKAVEKDFGVAGEEAEGVAKKVFRDEYKEVLARGIKSLNDLESMGKSRDEIVELLMKEDLEQWPNLVRHKKQVKEGK